MDHYKTFSICVSSRGGYRILKGAGPRGNVGQKARMNFATWGTFYAKFFPCFGNFSIKISPPWASFPQYVPQLGHSLRKMCPSWDTFSVKTCPSWGIFMRFDGTTLARGGAMAPFAPPRYPPLVVCTPNRTFSAFLPRYRMYCIVDTLFECNTWYVN